MSQVAKETGAAGAPKRVQKTKWIIAGLLLLVAALIVINLPRGYSDDLSRIGKGKASVVLIRDKNAVQSFDLMTELNSVRDQFSGKVEFLLTDFDTAQGKAFIEANHAGEVSVVFLDANGHLVKVLYAPQSAGSLQQEISALLNGSAVANQ
jgi:hypothetical protein